MAKALSRRGGEIPLLIEYIVEGQQHLRLHKLHVPAPDQRGGIHDVLSCTMFGGSDVSGDHGDVVASSGSGDLAKSLTAACDKRGFFQQIGGRIPANRQLRKQHKVRSTLSGTAGEVDDFCGVAAEIADGGIDLSERDLHIFSLATMQQIPAKRRDSGNVTAVGADAALSCPGIPLG
jgi:hypothetical protein